MLSLNPLKTVIGLSLYAVCFAQLTPSVPPEPHDALASEIFFEMTIPSTIELGSFPLLVTSASWALVDDTKS